MDCIDETLNLNLPCLNNKCRYYLEFPKDLNCTHIAIAKNGKMKLEQIGERLQLTSARIKQIENDAIANFKKKSYLLRVLE